ncbi:hypothetical protein GCM10027215_16880 [Nocardioides zeae]
MGGSLAAETNPPLMETVLMLGMSLGGIGKEVSTITSIGGVGSSALREAHESLWDAAKVLEPLQPAQAALATPDGST